MTVLEKKFLQLAYQNYKDTGSGRVKFIAPNKNVLIECVTALPALRDDHCIIMLSDNLDFDTYSVSDLQDITFEYEITGRGISYYEKNT